MAASAQARRSSVDTSVIAAGARSGYSRVKGKSVEEALEIKNTDIVEELSLPPVKIHCSVLAEDAIRAALSDYRSKQGDEPAEARETPQDEPAKS